MIIKLEGISKNFIRKRNDSNIFTALSELSLMLEAGKVYVISGRSGSGKTTFANVITGLSQPSTGHVLYEDSVTSAQTKVTDIYELSDEDRSAFINRHIGIIPQGQSALHSLNVLENIMFPVEIAKGYHDDVDIDQ